MSSTLKAKCQAGPRIGVREFTYTLVTNVVIQGCTIIQGILLARLLGPMGRGQFAAAIMWPSLFASMCGMGVGVALARRAARSPDLTPVIRTGLLMALATGTLATAICAPTLRLLLPSGDPLLHRAAYAFLPFIVCNHVALIMVAIDQGAGRFRRMNWTRLIVNPVYLGLVIFLWLVGVRDVLWFVVCLLIANCTVAIARIQLAMREGPLLGPLEPVKAVFREALPFGLAGLLNPLTQSVDKALLLYLLGTAELGFYTVALTAASVVNSLAGATGTVAFGMSAQANDREGFDRLARMFRFSAWTWLLAGLALAGVIPVVMPLIYGSDFSPSVLPAILLIPAAAFSGQAGILEESMRAQGRAFIGLEARLAGMLVMLGAGWVLAPTYGVLGVAVASLASQVTVFLVMIFAARWHFQRASLGLLLPRSDDLLDLGQRLLRSARRGLVQP